MKITLNIIALLLLASGCVDNSSIYRNLSNSKKLEVGMGFNKAIHIMGEPISIKKNKNNSIYNYDTESDLIYEFHYGRPTGASSGVSFVTDSIKILKIHNTLD